MIPTIAIVGRPNVGKSTLFNCLTRTRDALVADMPGVTRDRQYGFAHFADRTFIVVDTGGLMDDAEGIDSATAEQAWQAIEEADALLFVVDAQSGIVPADVNIMQQLRPLKKPIFLTVNKTDGLDADAVSAEFYSLGVAQIYPIAAAHGRGISNLVQQFLQDFPVAAEETEEQKLVYSQGIKIAVVGRPNVGKSTLVNRILGEERVLVYDQPGTTRDSIFIPFQRKQKDYVLIDTAGVRRRGRIEDVVEKFSVIKTLQAIETANVVVFILDARENLSTQDMHLLGLVLQAGKCLVIAVNKWDNLAEQQRKEVQKELDRRLEFVRFAKIHFISALHGTGVGDIFTSVEKAYRSAMKELATPELTRLLEQAVERHQPPLVKGKRIKLRYAHQGGKNPPVIVIHGNQTQLLPEAYRRYLINFYRKRLRLVGTPIHLELRSGKNPFA